MVAMAAASINAHRARAVPQLTLTRLIYGQLKHHLVLQANQGGRSIYRPSVALFPRKSASFVGVAIRASFLDHLKEDIRMGQV